MCACILFKQQIRQFFIFLFDLMLKVLKYIIYVQNTMYMYNGWYNIVKNIFWFNFFQLDLMFVFKGQMQTLSLITFSTLIFIGYTPLLKSGCSMEVRIGFQSHKDLT